MSKPNTVAIYQCHSCKKHDLENPCVAYSLETVGNFPDARYKRPYKCRNYEAKEQE